MKYLIMRVAEDLTNARLYLNYIIDLDEHLSKKYIKVLSSAYTFWSNTIRVYQLAMQTCLMRAYDQTDGAIGLKLLLYRIKDNIELFSKESFEKRMKNNPQLPSLMKKRLSNELFEKQLHEYINHVNGKKELVKNLIIIRNNNGFHKSEKVLYGEKPTLNAIEISFKDIKTLIDDGLNILNFFSLQFDGVINASYMVGYGDHESIFEILGKHYNTY